MQCFFFLVRKILLDKNFYSGSFRGILDFKGMRTS